MINIRFSTKSFTSPLVEGMKEVISFAEEKRSPIILEAEALLQMLIEEEERQQNLLNEVLK